MPDGGPPNKWRGISTREMNSPDDLAQALSNLSAEGFTGPVVAVPDPHGNGINEWWVAVGGYKDK